MGVQLDGLVKNKAANGKIGTLHAYIWIAFTTHARWDNKNPTVTNRRPRLLKPLELKRMPLPQPSADAGIDGDDCSENNDSSASQSRAIVAGWAKLEARQAAWKEDMESRQIELLEREEQLRKVQEGLDVQQQLIQEQQEEL